ncbi:MAG TPA: hypothetical protein RMH99_27035, partial [Sandaracinaceae bacterium LLY-WYZ-13_1]|nr:hypothetical protein [Sandaracinaceae bacterium LLY-WYZ-13_1]
ARRYPTPTPVAAEPDPQRAPAHSWQTGGGGGAPLDDDLDSLLDRALGDASPDPRPTARRTLPDTPTRRQVATTLRALEGDVRRCGGDGVADTRIVVAGDTGRVVGVSVGGDAAGTSAASCVADHVRSARFPRFSRERFTIRFPYALD